MEGDSSSHTWLIVLQDFNLIKICRIGFAAARGGHMIDVMSYVHVDSRIPSPAIIFSVSYYFIII